MKTAQTRAITAIILTGSLFAVAQPYSGGGGSSDEPYQISTVADWVELTQSPDDWDKHFILTADVDVVGIELTPVAPDIDPDASGFQGVSFGGVFDGQHHKILNAVINLPGIDYVGLFGYVGPNGRIRNLGLINISVTGKYRVGGLAGQNDGELENCFSTGAVSGSPAYYIGGLVGQSKGTVTRSYSLASVSGNSYVGGLVGLNNPGKILFCYATGPVSGNSYVGGLVGAQYSGSRIEYSYSTGYVSGNNYVGGMLGHNGGDSSFIPPIPKGTVISSVWDKETSGWSTSAGGTGKDSYQMKVQSTFTALGWNFTSVWWMPYNHPPRLAWEKQWTKGYSGGDGTAVNPYRISTLNDWQEMMHTPQDWNKQFILTNDIDFTCTTLTPIGSSTSNGLGFSGTKFTGGFDGQGHVLWNVDLRLSQRSYVGLFGCIGSGGTIRNLGIRNATISGDSYVGGLAGWNESGTIEACFFSGSVSSSNSSAYYVGGLIGHNGGSITDSYVTGSVNSLGRYAGGLVGGNSGQSARIECCYAAAVVTGQESVGGLAGLNSASIRSCFWELRAESIADSAGGVGLSPAQMQDSIYYAASGWAGTRWTIATDDYPRLIWENAEGNVITEPEVTMAGNGTAGDPWRIADVEEFRLIGKGNLFWDKHYRLVTDLDLAGIPLSRIGYDAVNSFSGSFDGNGHILYNAAIHEPQNSAVGIFGNVGPDGRVEFLGLENVNITGNLSVGGLAGINTGAITGCYVTGTISGANWVGGLVGSSWGTITACYAAATVSGDSTIGVLTGRSLGELNSCFWDMEAFGPSGGGGKGLTTAQMKSVSVFQNAGWGNHGWFMRDGHDYPRLSPVTEHHDPVPVADPVPLSGSGTETDPYRIYTAQEYALLSWVVSVLDKHFRLMNNIDLGEAEIFPIGDLGRFQGVFDGRDYRLLNASLHQPANNHIGLFASLGTEAEIRNLHIRNIVVNGKDYVGGLAGRTDSSLITNCSVTGIIQGENYIGGLAGYIDGGNASSCFVEADVTGTVWYVGGIVGWNGGTLTACRVNGTVSGDSMVGGIAGWNNYVFGVISDCHTGAAVSGISRIGGLVGLNGDVITNSYAIGAVTGSNLVGGLVGWNPDGKITASFASGEVNGLELVGGLVGSMGAVGPFSSIRSCYATGSVSGNSNVGGLIGQVQANHSPGSVIENCYAVGNISGNSRVGGLIGYRVPSYIFYEILNCFWDTQSSGIPQGVGSGVQTGIEGKTTLQMKTLGTFIDAGWDFSEIDGDPAVWTMPENTYPELIWQTGIYGSRSNPFQIRNVTDWLDLIETPEKWGLHFALTRNIDFAGVAMTPVAPDTDPHTGGFQGVPFTGSLDGRGFALKNMVIDLPNEDFVGVFGRVGSNGEILNLGIEAITVVGRTFAGGLCGQNVGGILANCFTTGSVTATLVGNSWAGGLTGVTTFNGVLTDCYSSAVVSGHSRVGGLTGQLGSGEIRRSYAEGNVTGAGENIGGLVGLIYDPDASGTIRNSYAVGTMTGGAKVGGFVGNNSRGKIIHCYSVGRPAGFANVGGFCGIADTGSGYEDTANFWNTTTSQAEGGSMGIGKATQQMKSMTTFTDAEWNFNQIWAICEGTNYPRLRWQIPVADFVCPDGVGIEDLTVLASSWLLNLCAQTDHCDGADLNKDGTVNLADFVILADFWLQ